MGGGQGAGRSKVPQVIEKQMGYGGGGGTHLNVLRWDFSAVTAAPVVANVPFVIRVGRPAPERPLAEMSTLSAKWHRYWARMEQRWEGVFLGGERAELGDNKAQGDGINGGGICLIPPSHLGLEALHGAPWTCASGFTGTHSYNSLSRLG